MLTAEFFCLQLCLGALLLTIRAFYLQFELFCLQLSFFAYGGKVYLRSTSTDCKQRSSTVSKKAPTLVARAIRNAIRANHSQLKPLFFTARQADSPGSLKFPIRANPADSRESCESIRSRESRY